MALAKGFTLVEAMVATVVLLVGVVFLSSSFFVSMDSYQYYTHYLNVVSWSDDKVWDAQDKMKRLGSAANLEDSGTLTDQGKDFSWNMTSGSTDDTGDLYKADLVLSWQEGTKNRQLHRSAYAIYDKPK